MLGRSVRTTQPQEPVGIDWGNPLARGLICALDPVSFTDVVNQRPLTRVGTLGKSPGRYGVATLGDAASLGWVPVTLTSESFSMIGVMNSATCPAAGSLNFGLGSSAGNQLATYQANNNPNNRFLLRQTNGGGTSILEFLANGRTEGSYVVSGVFTGSATGQIANFFNGAHDRGNVLEGSSGSSTVFNRFAIGGLSRSTDAGAQVGNNCVLALLFNRALSDAEIKSLSDNPWQIFAPDNKRLWVPATTSVTLPTLVSPASTTSMGAWFSNDPDYPAASLAEAVPSDETYIQVNSASTCEFVLAESAFPGTANQTLAYRALSFEGSTLTVTLKQGATTIMTRTHALTSIDTLYTQTLTAPEIASIIAGAISVTLTSS